MKRIFAILMVFSLLFSLCSCSLYYDYVNCAVDSFDVGYREIFGANFLADYNWDGTEEGMNIVVPESYNGSKIIGLGGYTGKGVPSPFKIKPTDEVKEQLCPNATKWSYITHTANIENYNIQYLPFKLHISSNISKIEYLSMGGIILAEYEENQEKIYNVYVLTCYVTCDENNEVFYSKDGKLYYKESDKVVEGVFYEDFDIEKHNEEHRDGMCEKAIF